MTRRQTLILAVGFFFGGATSLVLEVSWAKELGYTLGSTQRSVATVIAAFMAGLGIGSAIASRWGPKFTRPLRVWAVLQAGIGLSGFFSIPILRAVSPIFADLAGSGEPGVGALFIRFFLVFFLLVFPTTLMGMTLPIVVGALGRSREDWEASAGLLYGLNTLGAVLGTVVAGYFLLRVFGLQGTCFLTGSVDLGLAALGFFLDRRVGPIPSPAGSSSEERWNLKQWGIAGLFGASGAAALACQVAWFRGLSLVVGPSSFAFSAILAVFLFGIAAGSLAMTRLLAKVRLRGLTAFATAEIALAALVYIGLTDLNALPHAWGGIFTRTWDLFPNGGFLVAHLILTSRVLLLPCLAMGATFPAAARAVREAADHGNPEVGVGRLYLLNTIGSIVGSLAAGFYFLPQSGFGNVLAEAAAISLALAGVAVLLGGRQRSRLVLAGVILLLIPASLKFAPAVDLNAYNRGFYREIYQGREFGQGQTSQLLFHREGIDAPVAIYKQRAGVSLRVSGKADASNGRDDIVTQNLSGLIPALLARKTEKICVIGYGSGTTVGAMLSQPETRKIDLIEIEPATIEASHYFDSINSRALSDPRVRVVLDDGRSFVANSSDKWDIITSEPSNPWMVGIAKLFNKDFYESVADHLEPGGILGQWVQTYEVSERTVSVVLATIHDVFPHIAIFHAGVGDLLVIASLEPIEVDQATFEDRFHSARDSFRRAGLYEPTDVLAHLIGTSESLAEYLGAIEQRSTDDNLWLETRMPKELMSRLNERVDLSLARASAAGRTAALQKIWPDVDLVSSLTRQISYLSSREPMVSDTGRVPDPYAELRAIFVESAQAGLTEYQRATLAESVEAAYEKGLARATATMALTEALRSGELSRELLENAIQTAPDLPMAWTLYARSLYEAEEYPAAERAYRKALEWPSSESYYDALLGLGNVLVVRAQIADPSYWSVAFDTYRQVVDWNPYKPEGWITLAQLHQHRGEADAVRAVALEALVYNPDVPGLLEFLDP